MGVLTTSGDILDVHDFMKFKEGNNRTAVNLKSSEGSFNIQKRI